MDIMDDYESYYLENMFDLHISITQVKHIAFNNITTIYNNSILICLFVT